ncbi:MAG: tetratricopeptide repeat protein, partial [Candidatus Sericytochromatia bacterium]
TYIQKIKNEKSPNDHVAEIEGYMKEAQNYFDNACNSGLEESCQNMEVQILKSSLRIGFTPYELETIDSLYNEGLNFYNQKRYDDAISPLEEANKLDPRNTKIARLTLTAKKEKGLDLIKKGKKEEGEKIVEEVEFLTSFLEFAEISNEEKLLKEVSSEIEKNNFKAVIEKLEGVKSKYAEIQERIDFALLMSYSNGIEKFFKENDFDGAKKQIDKIDSILKETKLSNEFTKPAKLSVIFFSKIISIKEAYYLLEEDKYKEAEIALNKILEKEPNNSSAYSSLAYVKSKTGEIDKGIELAKKSIELDPKDPFNYYDLASIYLDKNDKVNAISNLKQSIKIEPVFKDYLKTSKDKDMDKIRNSKEFKEL